MGAWEALTLRRVGWAGPATGGVDQERSEHDDVEDFDDHDLDELLGDDADEPLGRPGPGRAPAVIAMGLVGASFVTFCFSVVLSHSALWQLAVGLGAAALLSFILLPFFVMLRSHR
jgi:hypothetical protein